jgi:hypothetical protein
MRSVVGGESDYREDEFVVRPVIPNTPLGRGPAGGLGPGDWVRVGPSAGGQRNWSTLGAGARDRTRDSPGTSWSCMRLLDEPPVAAPVLGVV